jgi:hypothetical protein
VERDLPGASVLAAAHAEPPLEQLDVRTVKRDRLADPHASHGQQPDQRLIGGGLQWRADPARRAHQRLDLGFRIQVGDGAAELGW